MPMLTTARVLNRYDHRLRDLVYATADSTIARINGVPRSTAKLERYRIPDPKNKTKLIQAVDRATAVIPKRSVLAVIGLSYSRYHSWTNADICQLTDLPSCPKSHPNQLTGDEVAAMRDMVEDKELRHLTTCALVRLARKLGKVFASQSCWFRIIRKQGWKRPRYRIYPAKPKIGIRATKPNEI